MKKQLSDKLSKIERTMSWFWKHQIEKQTNLTYPAFMNQLAERSPIRDDIKKIIDEYLEVK